MNNKKSSIILILNVLKKYSDEKHPLTQEKIINIIKKENGIDLERKSIGRNINTLIDLDYSIEHTHDGYYLSEREFEESEVSYLIDAIFSSKSMTGKYASDLSEKILKTQSCYVQKKYTYVSKSNNITRTINPEFFLNINLINEAIDKNKVITFNYLQYNEYGKMVPKNTDFLYKVCPYYLINNDGKYYLLGTFYKENPPYNLVTYRIEFMRDLQIDDSLNRIDETLVKGLGENFKIDDYINTHIYMFNDEIINAKLLITDIQTVTAILDTFGKNATISKTPKGAIASIKCDESSLFYWCLQYNESVMILSPKKFRERMFMNLKMVLRKYKELNLIAQENPSKPKINELIVDFMNDLRKTNESIISKSIETLRKDLRIYLYDHTMPNYKTIDRIDSPNIIITNDIDELEKYGIDFIMDNNDATNEKFFNIIKCISYLEEIKLKDKYKILYLVFFTNNPTFNYSNELNNELFKYFSKNGIETIKNNIVFNHNNEIINLKNDYNISWKSIKFLKDGFYNYTIITI